MYTIDYYTIKYGTFSLHRLKIKNKMDVQMEE